MTGDSVKPPGAPWHALTLTEPFIGYLSIYLSDDLARYPVRAVTLQANNKSDPNLETMTYGVFSTCEPKLRAGAVTRGARYLFFATNHRRRGRCLTGYYTLRWWAEGALGAARRDFALAAEGGRFIDPIPLSGIHGAVGAQVGRRFRQMLLLGPDHVDALRAIVDAQPDRTERYLDEIKRLETFNRFHTGKAYVGWSEGGGFDWASAARYLIPAKGTTQAPNASPTGIWMCAACGSSSVNKALLKRCPGCGEVGTLIPAPAGEG